MLLTSLAPFALGAPGPSLFLSLDLLRGQDDQLLSDPERLGVVRPLSEGYFSGSARAFFRWEDWGERTRVDLLTEAGGTTYGSEVDGDDHELRFNSAVRRRLNDKLAVDVAAGAWRFRRESSRLFDADGYRADAVAAVALSPRSLLTFGVKHGWASFPGRFASADSAGMERSRQLDLSLGATRRIGGDNVLAGELAFRWARGNVERNRYHGPVFSVRSRWALPAHMNARTFISYGHRHYPYFPLLERKGDMLVETGNLRMDNTWQFGLTLERPVVPRVRVFFDVSLLRQESTVPEFAYNQARGAVGLNLDLISIRPRPLTPGRPPQLAPVMTPQGVLFRIHAPDARSVAVAGGFNGWSRDRHLLYGPDRDGMWETVVALEPGIWRYAFVVDGSWTEPPDAPRYEADGFGGTHGVLTVSQVEKNVSVTPSGEIRPR